MQARTCQGETGQIRLDELQEAAEQVHVRHVCGQDVLHARLQHLEQQHSRCTIEGAPEQALRPWSRKATSNKDPQALTVLSKLTKLVQGAPSLVATCAA